MANANDDNFPPLDYREPFFCPFHGCTTDKGWCWECAEETYGYEEAKRIHGENKLLDKIGNLPHITKITLEP